MTLLTAIQSVSSHPAVGQSTSVAAVIGTSTPAVVQMQALLQQEVNELRSRHDWSGLLTDANFTLGAPVNSVITASLPADFRRLANDTVLFHVGQRRQTVGPVSGIEWQTLTIVSKPNSTVFWRRLGDTLQFVGASQADVINYQYVSKYPIASSGGTAQASFAADTDTLRVPEELAILGTIWRWRSAKGMDYSQEKNSYDMAFERTVADDRANERRLIALSASDYADPTQLPFTITVT